MDNPAPKNVPILLERKDMVSDETWDRYLNDIEFRRGMNEISQDKVLINITATGNPVTVGLDDLDYGEDAPKPAAPTELTIKDIGDLCNTVRGMDIRIDAAEESLKDLKERRRRIVEGVIPEAMERAGVSTLRLADGTEVSVKEVVQTSIRADLRPRAWQWLRENGHADVLKNEAKVVFMVGEEKKASEFAQKVMQTEGRACTVETWAEPATVRSIISKRLEANKTVDMDLFGVRKVKEAKFKEAKQDTL